MKHEENSLCPTDSFVDDAEEEFRLAQQLKNNHCDISGKEIDPEKAAEVIYQIGLVYRKRSPDKLSLIKSVGLLNAAVLRNPQNVSKIQSALSEICKHILLKADVSLKDVDLIEKANDIKQTINKLRNEVETLLTSPALTNIPSDVKNEELHELQINKIFAIQQINKTVADTYKQLMADVSIFCKDVMGSPPCEFAIVGMGSLARQEITPYSDFDHIMLLDECIDGEQHETILDYFRWFSVIFHVIILNMQETIIPALNIETLNSADSSLGNWYFDAFTPRGISFDGMMPHACKFPLGRAHTKSKPWTTELIKPVSEMLHYLGSEENLKNGYHLADILTKTCFVFGNENLFEKFRKGAQNYQQYRTNEERIDDVKQQVKEDMNSFSTRFRLANLKKFDVINVKQLVYRSTTIFIAALGRIRNISANSCFEIVSELLQNGQISENTAQRLSYAIAIACEMRLRVYCQNKSQCDNAIDLRKHGAGQFLDIIGVFSTLNYFQIAYCLQCEVAKQLCLTKLHFYSDPQLINVTIGLAFGVASSFTSSIKMKQLTVTWKLLEFDFDTCIEQLEKLNFNVRADTTKIFDLELMKSLASYLYQIQVYDEAYEFNNQLLAHYQSISIDESTDVEIARLYDCIASCVSKMKTRNKALPILQKSLKIFQMVTLDQERDAAVARLLNKIGNSLRMLNQNDLAYEYLTKSLAIKYNLSSGNEQKNVSFAGGILNIGICLRTMGRLDDALKYMHQSLEIFQNAAVDKTKDSRIASVLNSLGLCSRGKKQFADALKFLKESLQIRQNISRNEKNDREISHLFFNIGLCLQDMHQFGNALNYFKQSLEVRQNRSLDEQKDVEIADASRNCGLCLNKMHQYDNALQYLKSALEIYKCLPATDRVQNDINRVEHEIQHICSQIA